jgi:hypothetical protein
MKFYDDNKTCWLDVIVCVAIAAALFAFSYGVYMWVKHFAGKF